MNRRDFLRSFNPFSGSDSSPPPADSQPKAVSRDDLFLLAMAEGIDPATIDPGQLLAMLGRKAETSL